MERSWTTDELKAATAYSPAMLVELEKNGIIARTARNNWPMPQTILAIVKDLRARLQQGESSSEARLRETKQTLLQLKLARETRQVTDVEESLQVMDEVVGHLLARLDALPVQIAGRANLSERERIDVIITDLRNDAAAFFAAKADAFRRGVNDAAVEDA